MHVFRPAAIEAKHTKWLGEIVLIRPVSFSLFTLIAAVISLIILGFVFFFSYTKKVSVSGQLLPSSGLMKIYATQSGVVLEKKVAEGAVVVKGDILYVLSSDRQSNEQGGIQAIISAQVTARAIAMRDELGKTKLLQGQEIVGLKQKIQGLEDQVDKLATQIDGQQRRVKLAEASLSRYQGLLTQDFISKEQLEQKQEDVLDQEARLQSLQRDKISTSQELNAQRTELTSIVYKHQNDLSQIERGITSAGQELTESEGKRRLLVIAPENGIATAISTEIGQMVDPAHPLLSIVPAGARMQAIMFAPSRSVGFIKQGDPVLLRYQAYPYQKFGHALGTVSSVSKTAIPSSELANAGSIYGGENIGANEPVYRITVTLEKQSILAYGNVQTLQSGMLLDADIIQDTRKLYEWVLEPLYSISGKI